MKYIIGQYFPYFVLIGLDDKGQSDTLKIENTNLTELFDTACSS